MGDKIKEFNSMENLDIKNILFVESFTLRTKKTKGIKKYFNDILTKHKKSDYKFFSEIRIKGDKDEVLEVETCDMKFKEYKAIIAEASPDNVESIEFDISLEFLVDVDEIEINDALNELYDAMEFICDRYNCKVRVNNA